MTLTAEEYAFILRRDFLSFIERSFHELNPQVPYLDNPHIAVIASKLEACRRGDIKRLIVTLPPRHLKSHCASIAFPAWILGHNPSAHVICASYGQELADKFARDCRNLMLAPWYRHLFRTRLSARSSVHDFATTDHGTRFATSVGGVLTGRGADFIIIDDAAKPDDAMSESRRNNVNGWYDNTLLSRLNDKANGCIVIIMQRLHQDDLAGHVLEQEGWEVVSFPAIAGQDEVHVVDSLFGSSTFRRRAGEALHPARESLETLSAIRQNIGDYNWHSQYQQDPTPVGGAMVKTDWLRYYEPAERPQQFSRVVLSWDTANKASELSDYSVCTTWGVADRTFYLLDVYRERLNYPDLRRKAVELARHHSASNIVIEDKASGTQLIQDLQADGVFGVVPYDPPAGADKIVRLHMQTPMFESGRVLLPRSAAWLADYVFEVTTFPGAKYDDQVDSTTQALAYLRESDSLEIWARLARVSAFDRLLGI